MRPLDSHWLVPLPIAHLAGMTLTGFRFEPFLGRSCWALRFFRASELKTLSGDRFPSLTPTALSFGWSLTWWE
jgi:hypothetical protein